MEIIKNLEQRAQQAALILKSRKEYEQKLDESLICLEKAWKELSSRNGRLEQKYTAVSDKLRRLLQERHDLDGEIDRLREDGKKSTVQLTQSKEEVKRLSKALTAIVSAVERDNSVASEEKRIHLVSNLTETMRTKIEGCERNSIAVQECEAVEQPATKDINAKKFSGVAPVKDLNSHKLARNSTRRDGPPSDISQVLSLIKQSQEASEKEAISKAS